MSVGLGLFISTLPSELPMNIAYLAKAYSEPEICKEALEIAKKNPKVLETLGELEPMGPFDILEGYVSYSKDGEAVAITIRVKGSKSKKQLRSKMDVQAKKNKKAWEYQKIQIRIKNPVEMRGVIPILEK